MAAETIVEEFFRLANQISRYAPLITHEQNVRETGGNIPRWTPLGGERISNSRRLQGYLAIQNPRLTWLCIRISSVLRRLERAEGNGVAEIMALHVASLFREGRVQIFSSLRRDLRRMETQLQKFERSDSSVIQTANRLSQLCGVNRAKIVGRAFLAREKQIFEENSRIEGSDNDYNDSVLVALAAGFYLCSEPENIIRDLDDFVLEIYPSLRDSLARGDYLTDLVSRFLSEVPVDRFPGLVSNLIQTGSYSSSYFHPIKRRYGEIDAANKHALVLALLSGKSVGFGIEFIEEQDPGYLRQNLSDLDFSRVWLALMGNHGWDVDTPSTDLIREGFPLLEKGIVPITDLRKEVFDRFFQSLQGEVSVERFHECLKRVRSDELAQCLFIRGGVKAKCGDQLWDGVEAPILKKWRFCLIRNNKSC